MSDGIPYQDGVPFADDARSSARGALMVFVIEESDLAGCWRSLFRSGKDEGHPPANTGCAASESVPGQHISPCFFTISAASGSGSDSCNRDKLADCRS